MGRATLDLGGGIEVAYGRDHVTGYFLAVTDERRKDDPILDMHTGPMGFGKKVDLATMLENWKNYGVLEGHIQRAWRGEDVSESSPSKVDPNSCKVCFKPTNMKCSKCKTVYACNKQHAKQGWKDHKARCDALAPPQACTRSKEPSAPLQASTESKERKSAEGYPIKTVKGFLFPVDENSPRIVDVDCEVRPPDPEGFDPGYDYPSHSASVLTGRTDSTMISSITTAGYPWHFGCTGPTIDIFGGDRFLIDGSPLNRCIQYITNGKAKHWAGSFLVMKHEDAVWGKIRERYVDVDGETLTAATAYFTNYPWR